VKSSRTVEGAQRELIRLSHSGLTGEDLLREAMTRLERVVPFEAYWAATTDPTTVLFTGSVGEGLPASISPLFLANEIFEADYNQFGELARGPRSVRSLFGATGGDPDNSKRYREIMAPAGLGDELRAALRTGESCWGVICLHRELSPSGFAEEETALLERLVPHLAEGLRTAVLLAVAQPSVAGDGPGVLLLNDELRVVSMTPAAEALLHEAAGGVASKELPQVITAVAARLKQLEHESEAPPNLLPRARFQTAAGRWLVAHASRLGGSEPGGHIAVALEGARPAEMSPLRLAAFALTRRETEIAGLILTGLSTEAIAAQLVISPYTVQQHLKAIFEKVGVRSRRELVAQILAEHYQPVLSGGDG
jgi:DNA-binding CsgD family transcriptional regulator